MQKSVLLHSLNVTHFKLLGYNYEDSIRVFKRAKLMVWVPSTLVFLILLLLAFFSEDYFLRILFWSIFGIGIVLIGIGWSELKEHLSEPIQYYKRLQRHRDELLMLKHVKKLGAAVPPMSTYADMMKIFTPYSEKEFNYLISIAERHLPEDLPDSEIEIAASCLAPEFEIRRLSDRGDFLDFSILGS